MIFHPALLLAAFSLLSNRALAQEAKPPAEDDRLDRLFAKLDKDNDKKLTAEEVGSAALLKRWDRDCDGFVTIEEIRASEASDSETAAKTPQVTEERCKLAAEYSAAT